MKVLVAEDDASLREGMSDVLMELAEVRPVDSVDAALKALQQERFALVLTDLRLAGKGQGGRSILEAARRKLLPAAIVSAATPEDLQRALQPIEPDALLAKPFQLEDMMALVERFLGLCGDVERLSKERPPESGWVEEAAGVQILRVPGGGSNQGLTWIRLQPGASYSWSHHRGRAGVWVVEGSLEVEGERREAPLYLFLSSGDLPTVKAAQGCLAVSLAMKG
ncbi:response regulator [Hyalangium versicolor]|uniref:response regulator n=1 Tax=Hyalangium versicolor TaxID=2861190 RepID=UPI001CCF9EBB|nr:response regulator [Hyalangium versicolor]